MHRERDRKWAWDRFIFWWSRGHAPGRCLQQAFRMIDVEDTEGREELRQKAEDWCRETTPAPQ